jgi:hypothetical protein
MCNFLFLDDEELKDEDEEKKIVESYYDLIVFSFRDQVCVGFALFYSA